MILIDPSTEILQLSDRPLELIELAGRTCYKSEGRISPDSAEPFVKRILGRQHDSVLEHASMTVRFVVDRGVSHELVRHRLASFSQESTRYCDYTKKQLTFIRPPWVDVQCLGQWDSWDSNDVSSWKVIGLSDDSFAWMVAMECAEVSYRNLRDRFEWSPEKARSVLPNSLKTEVVMTANLREWRHVFKLRTSGAAHPQMRQVMEPLLKKAASRVAVVFDDLIKEPEE